MINWLFAVMYHLQNLLWWLNWWLSCTVVHHCPSVTDYGIFQRTAWIQKTILSDHYNVLWISWAFHIMGWIVGHRFLPAVMRNKIQCPQFPLHWRHYFFPATALLLVLMHSATLCNTTYSGYFSCCLFWLCILVIKNINASWLHPISALFPPYS